MRKLVTIAVVALALVGGGWMVRAQTSSGAAGDKAKVVDVFGAVQKRIGDEKAKWANVNVGDLLPSKTTVKTAEKSAALLLLPDKHVFRIGAQTTIELREVGKDKNFSFNVVSGKVWSFVNSAAKPTKYEVETPSAVVGVTGTLFSVFHDAETNETMVSADEGEVTVRQGERRMRVAKGFLMRLRRNQPAPPQVMQHPEQMRKMWQHVRQHEGWMKPKDGLRLNPKIEERLKDLLKRQPPPPRRPPPSPRNRSGPGPRGRR